MVYFSNVSEFSKQCVFELMLSNSHISISIVFVNLDIKQDIVILLRTKFLLETSVNEHLDTVEFEWNFNEKASL